MYTQTVLPISRFRSDLWLLTVIRCVQLCDWDRWTWRYWNYHCFSCPLSFLLYTVLLMVMVELLFFWFQWNIYIIWEKKLVLRGEFNNPTVQCAISNIHEATTKTHQKGRDNDRSKYNCISTFPLRQRPNFWDLWRWLFCGCWISILASMLLFCHASGAVNGHTWNRVAIGKLMPGVCVHYTNKCTRMISQETGARVGLTIERYRGNYQEMK